MENIANCTFFARAKKVLSLCDSQSVNGSGDSSSSYRVSKVQSAPSWETPVLQKQLGKDHPGSMGVRNHTKLQSTFQSAALPALPTKSLNSLSRRGSSHAAGDSEYAREACNRRNHTQGAWFPVNHLPGSQERWRPEARNQSEELKQVCLHRAFQNGGYTHPERPAKSRRLDDKSGPEGCILHGANPRGGQSLPQVLIQREGIPIQMPTVWPGMRPMGLHQDLKATCCSVETTGNATDRLHRRHPHPGRVQGSLIPATILRRGPLAR